MKPIKLFLLTLILSGVGWQLGADGSLKLPPLSKGVTELNLSELFNYPIGPAGLRFTDKVKNLAGKRVRVVGYMVRQEKAPPGCFLLAPVPVELHEEHYGLADDLPASTLFVFDAHQKSITQYRSGPVLVSGTLRIGNREEADGRISQVRLTLDSPPRELGKVRRVDRVAEAKEKPAGK
jgi:hypothetical protein